MYAAKHCLALFRHCFFRTACTGKVTVMTLQSACTPTESKVSNANALNKNRFCFQAMQPVNNLMVSDV